MIGTRTIVATAAITCLVAATPLWAKRPAAGPTTKSAELSDRTYETIRDMIAPQPDELGWQRIPWRTTFWDGLVAAQNEDKPLLFFTMNGHPLGCT
jgi:hypothetical protein